MRKLNKKKLSVSEDLELSEFAITNDAFDKMNFKEIQEHNAHVKHTREEMIKDYPQIDNLQQDLYSALFKYNPELVDEGRMLVNYLMNNQILGSVIENPKYKELRTMTRLDPITSGVGLEVLGEEVKELINELKEAFEEAMNAINEANQEAQDAQDAADAAQKGVDGTEEKDGEEGEGNGKSKEALTLEQAKKRLEEAKKAQLEAEKDMREKVKKPLQTNMPRVLSNTIHKTREIDDLIRNWGLGSDETFGRKNYDQKLQLLDKLRNDPKLKKIADLTGRFKRIAMSAQHEKVKRGVDELYEIEMGGDLSKALPSELMRLGHPLLKWLFFKDLLEGKLLQYKYSGKEKKQRGPIIICIDESGSMNGDPEIWSKSVALAMLEIARTQKRDFHCIHFASSKSSLHTHTFLKGEQNNVEKVVDLASYFINGGTDFEPPLQECMNKVGDDAKFSKADILFVTDGEAPVTDSFLKRLKDWKIHNKVKIFSVLIDCGWGSSYTKSLEEFSDRIEKVSNMSVHEGSPGDKIAMDIFGRI